MTRRASVDRPRPTRTLAEDTLEFMEAHPYEAVTCDDVARGIEWPVQSVRVAMNYLCAYRPECIRVAPGVFAWKGESE